MAEQGEVKAAEKKVYVALVDMSGKWGTVLTGRPVPDSIIKVIGKDSGLFCLQSEYDAIVEKQKKENDDLIKKGEESRAKMIKDREAKKHKVK